MSKYIKLEDIKMLINACEWRMTLAKERHGEGFVDYDKQVLDVDELTKRLTDLPTIEVSEDCINRAEAIDALDWIPKHKQIGLVEWSIRESDVRGMLRKLPRVVPKQKTVPPMPSVKPSGRLERFNSVELKKILDNFCEQMACPLPEKTKNEIVANVAREHAMTVAADRLDQAMKESEE